MMTVAASLLLILKHAHDEDEGDDDDDDGAGVGFVCFVGHGFLLEGFFGFELSLALRHELIAFGAE